VHVGVWVSVAVEVLVGVVDALGVGVIVDVRVGVDVAVDVGELVWVAVGVPLFVGDGVEVKVTVAVADGVGVAVQVAVAVAVAVGEANSSQTRDSPLGSSPVAVLDAPVSRPAQPASQRRETTSRMDTSPTTSSTSRRWTLLARLDIPDLDINRCLPL